MYTIVWNKIFNLFAKSINHCIILLVFYCIEDSIFLIILWKNWSTTVTLNTQKITSFCQYRKSPLPFVENVIPQIRQWKSLFVFLSVSVALGVSLQHMCLKPLCSSGQRKCDQTFYPTVSKSIQSSVLNRSNMFPSSSVSVSVSAAASGFASSGRMKSGTCIHKCGKAQHAVSYSGHLDTV